MLTTDSDKHPLTNRFHAPGEEKLMIVIVLRDDLPDQSACLWTCFTPWCNTDEKPVFITTLKSPTR